MGLTCSMMGLIGIRILIILLLSTPRKQVVPWIPRSQLHAKVVFFSEWVGSKQWWSVASKPHKIWETEAASGEGTLVSENKLPQPGQILNARVPTCCRPRRFWPLWESYSASLIVVFVWVTLSTKKGCWRERRVSGGKGARASLGPEIPAYRTSCWS